jgi:hypothetical protein
MQIFSARLPQRSAMTSALSIETPSALDRFSGAKAWRLYCLPYIWLVASTGPLHAALIQISTTVVETPGSTARAPIGWTVSSQPEVRIGEIDGPAPYNFNNIGGAFQLSSGEILVVDRSGELRYFDHNGRFLYKTGGSGPGPGEFYWPHIIAWSGDSLRIVDQSVRRRRLAVMSFDGRSEHTTVPVPPRVEGIIGHSAIFYRELTPVINASLVPNESVEAEIVLTNLYTGVSKRLTHFASIPGPFSFTDPRSSTRVLATRPFTTPPSFAAGAHAFYVTRGDIPEIWEYSPASGDLLRTFRVNEPPRTITRAEYNSALDNYLTARDPSNPQAYRALPLPARVPVFQALHVDAQGWLWAKLYGLDEREPSTWVIFDSSGRARGSVQIPGSLSVRQIGTSFILATRRDQFGIEYVERYRLTRR